jgi:cytochrome d ubiquinol oxidase subunit II
MLILHGNTYAAMKLGEPMATRARSLGRLASAIFVVAFLGAGVWVCSTLPGYQISGVLDHSGPSDPTRKTVAMLNGAWLNNYHAWPWLWAAPAVALLGAAGAHVFLRVGRATAAFLASALVQAGTILTAGFALFPFLMPSSTFPNQSLTVWDASSSAKTLLIMLVVVIVFLPIVLAYTSWVYKVVSGRVTVEDVQAHEGGY